MLVHLSAVVRRQALGARFFAISRGNRDWPGVAGQPGFLLISWVVSRSRTIRTLTDGIWTELIVTDAGRGMKPEHVSNIGAYVQFERRIHEQQGSDLGLAIVSRLAELHGGHLSVSSQPGYGTTVTVQLPTEPMPVPGTAGAN